MKKKEINVIADKLGWTQTEVKQALDEFLKSESILEKNDLPLICAKADNPNQRFRNSIEYLLGHYKGNEIDLITGLLTNDDPCFKIIALFNVYDFIQKEVQVPIESPGNKRNRMTIRLFKFKDRSTKSEWRMYYTTGKKSYINWDTYPIYKKINDEDFLFGLVETHRLTTLDDIAQNPEKLRYKFLDLYLYYLRKSSVLAEKYPGGTTTMDELQPLFREVVGRVRYLAFNIESFRRQINFFCMMPNLKDSRNNLKKLDEIIVPTPKERQELTQRKYWLWYLLIEKLRENGYGVRPSFRKAVEILGESTYSGIARRYFEMKEKVKKRKLKDKQILEENNLTKDLEELLIRAGLIKEDSLLEFKI